MSDRKELQAWIRPLLDATVRELMNRGAIESMLVEAKPAWVLPYQLLLGKVREQGESGAFKWFICGEVPTDHVDATAASTPREAARHFAMKWQLDAARQQDAAIKTPEDVRPAGETGGALAEQAEALYALVDDANLWSR